VYSPVFWKGVREKEWGLLSCLGLYGHKTNNVVRAALLRVQEYIKHILGNWWFQAVNHPSVNRAFYCLSLMPCNVECGGEIRVTWGGLPQGRKEEMWYLVSTWMSNRLRTHQLLMGIVMHSRVLKRSAIKTYRGFLLASRRHISPLYLHSFPICFSNQNTVSSCLLLHSDLCRYLLSTHGDHVTLYTAQPIAWKLSSVIVCGAVRWMPAQEHQLPVPGP
jgi:hypothetical protein